MSGRLPDWHCPRCGHMIFGSKRDCARCLTVNPNWPKAAPGQTTSEAEAERPRLPDWLCPKCNFKVFGSKDTCFKCGCRNPGLLVSGAPVASSVSALPPPLAPAVSAVATAPAGKLADWVCPRCPNYLVFGSKAFCPKCNAPNPGRVAPPAAFGPTLYHV